MKKILALVLALIMISAFACTAFAEVRDYALAAVCDAEGNTIASVTDDLSQVLDADGNDITEEWPVLVFECNDEAMTGTFGTEEETQGCTLEMAEDESGLLVFTATLDDGTVMALYYDQEEDMFAYTDTDGNVYTLINIG